MSPPPDIHDLARQLAVLEERMNTLRAEYESALDRNNAAFERLRADMARHQEDAARRGTEAARRETRLIFAMIATVAIGLTVFGFVTA